MKEAYNIRFQAERIRKKDRITILIIGILLLLYII